MRRATPADAATVAALHAHVQCWHAGHSPEAFFPAPDPAAPGHALCALQPRALLAAARALARDLDCGEMLLDTRGANRDAQAFFAAEGFAPRRRLCRATP